MKAKILTHKGTIPIDEKQGRKKPFRLRATIGGKRKEFYFVTRAEAEKEWHRLARLAGHPGAPVTPTLDKSTVNDREASEYLFLRERLSGAGLTIDEALKLALTHKDAPSSTNPIPASKVLTEFLASFQTRAKKVDPQYVRETAKYCGDWVAHFGKDRDIREVKPGYETEFAEWVNGLGHGPDTTLFIFSRVRQLLNYAVKRKRYLLINPLTHAMQKDGLLPAPRANQGHTLTLPQARALMAVLETHFPKQAQYIAMQLFTGFRERQVDRLRLEFFKPHLDAFDLPPGVIRKARSGAVGDYLDALPDNLIAWVKFSTDRILNHTPGPKTAEAKEGKGPWQPVGRKIWTRIMRRMAELPEPFRIKEWPKNACRHTAATAAYSHFGIKRACEILGWANENMLKNQYAGKRWPAAEAEAYFAIKPGESAKLLREHPELKMLITATLFPRGGMKDWRKPKGWSKWDKQPKAA